MIRLKVRKTIETKSLLKDGDRVLACVSGGPDSIALLHLLVELCRYYDIEIFVAHLNHMLRGKEADADAEFVRKTADDLSLPFIAEKIDVKNIAKTRCMSIEEAAREARYDFYSRAAGKLNADKIATGHTRDDQAETVLMRLLKGSGSLGLSGIPYKRRFGDFWIIRPLLDATRKEIERYLKANRIPSRTDASNLETVYFRNKIRNALIPVLERYFNPNIKEGLSSMAATLSDESSFLTDLAAKKLKRIGRRTKRDMELRTKDFTREHVALQRLIVRQVIAGLKGDLKSISYRHWQGIEAIIKGSEAKSINLPGGIKAIKNRGKLIFTTKHRQQANPGRPGKAVTLKVPGDAFIPELGIRIKAEVVKSRPDFKNKKTKNIEYANGDLAGSRLSIRTRRAGDRMKPLGMTCYKKLHDIFIDDKIALKRRNRVPIVISRNKILWAAGVKLSDEFRVDGDTKKIVKLSVTNS